MTKPNYEEGDILEIRWYDIVEENSWTKLSKAKEDKPLECKSIGWLISEDGDCIRIAYHASIDGDVSYTIFPKKSIISISKVESAEIDDFKEDM